jgi:Ser/Thr protein kinase RdoA (MazF antagonist)
MPAILATRMLPLIDTYLAACRKEGWHARDLQCEVVQYKPGRLCTLRYLVQMNRPFRCETRTQEVYGKVYRDDRWRFCFDVQEACWNAACRSDGVWRAARPIMSMPAWRLSLQEAVSGRRFRQVLADLTHDDASEANLAQAEEHLRALARAIRSLQRAPVRLGPRCDFRWLLATVERNLPYLQRSEPSLAEELRRLTREIVLLEPTIPALPLGLAHCDLAHDNVLVDGDRIGIIDFDRAGQAEPAYDVAYFLTHLCSFGIRHPRRQQHVRRLCGTFRAAYLELAPEVSPERLALYEALELVSYGLRNFRKQSHQANWLRWAQGQIEAAWSCLGQAARHGGSQP